MTFDASIQQFVDQLRVVAPGYALVFVRVAGICVFAPLFGSAKIPRRVKALLTTILALGMAQGIPLPTLAPSATLWQLALGMAGELTFGLAMGMILSLVFI